LPICLQMHVFFLSSFLSSSFSLSPSLYSTPSFSCFSDVRISFQAFKSRSVNCNCKLVYHAIIYTHIYNIYIFSHPLSLSPLPSHLCICSVLQSKNTQKSRQRVRENKIFLKNLKNCIADNFFAFIINEMKDKFWSTLYILKSTYWLLLLLLLCTMIPLCNITTTHTHTYTSPVYNST